MPIHAYWSTFMEARSQPQRSLVTIYLVCLRQGLSLNLSSSNRLGCLTSSRDPPVSALLLFWRLQVHTMHGFLHGPQRSNLDPFAYVPSAFPTESLSPAAVPALSKGNCHHLAREAGKPSSCLSVSFTVSLLWFYVPRASFIFDKSVGWPVQF